MRSKRLYHFDDEAEYRVQGVYRVVLYRPVHYPRLKYLSLSEGSADRAVMTASMEDPKWCAIGVEPPNLSARLPRSDRSHSTSHTWHVA
jgi:hypothetical protein